MTAKKKGTTKTVVEGAAPDETTASTTADEATAPAMTFDDAVPPVDPTDQADANIGPGDEPGDGDLAVPRTEDPPADIPSEEEDPILNALDRKFEFHAISRSGNVYTERDAIVILARDPGLKEALDALHGVYKRLGADEMQMECMAKLYQRVSAYQAVHGVKLPGVKDLNEKRTLCLPYEPVGD